MFSSIPRQYRIWLLVAMPLLFGGVTAVTAWVGCYILNANHVAVLDGQTIKTIMAFAWLVGFGLLATALTM